MVESILQTVRQRRKRPLTNAERGMFADPTFAFVDDLTRKLNGHTGRTYACRDRLDILEEMKDEVVPSYRYAPERIDPAVREYFAPLVSNKLVLDLGCGDGGDGYVLADALNAGAYIGIENDFALGAEYTIKEAKGTTPYAICQEDLGEFLQFYTQKNYKAGLVIFSGIEHTSYTGYLPLSQVVPLIHRSLDDNGRLLIGGNIWWLKDDAGEELDTLFSEEKIIDINFIMKMAIYQKR